MPLINEHPYSELNQILENWLADSSVNLEELRGFLQGFNLPNYGQNESPYSLLLYGLPLGGNRLNAQVRLAERLAHLLNEEPDVTFPGQLPEDLLWNLFRLCAGLNRPEQLFEPLWECYRRQLQINEKRFTKRLRIALRGALLANQIDCRMWNDGIWPSMLTGQGDKFFAGDEYKGFEGTLWMHPSSQRLDESCDSNIGQALQMMAVHLDSLSQRRSAFRRLLHRVHVAYPSRTKVQWSKVFIEQADSCQWTGWAIECINDLFIELGADEQGKTRFYVWHFLNACLPKDLNHQEVRRLCNQHVIEILADPKAIEFLRKVSPIFEARRLHMPFNTNRAMVGTAVDVVAELELNADASGNEQLKQHFRRVRNDLLKHEGLMFTPDTIAIKESGNRVTSTHAPSEKESVIDIKSVAVQLYAQEASVSSALQIN